MTLPIRPAVATDIAALSALKIAAFRETFLEDFAIPYPPADLVRFEAEHYGEPRVAAELADPDHATWVVDGTDAPLIAYAHCGPCKLPHAEARPDDIELYQLYLLRAAQGTGLGRALMAEALKWMAPRAPQRQWLGVWSGNDRAQRFYASFGFRQVGSYAFMVGAFADHEFIFRRDL